MANNRLYLRVTDEETGEQRALLIAKGWPSRGWELWHPENLAKRLEDFLGSIDVRGAAGGSTSIRLETEHPVIARTRYSCLRGHSLDAFDKNTNSPTDLTGHFCTVCLGAIVGEAIDSRILGPEGA